MTDHRSLATLGAMDELADKIRRWKRVEYDRLIETGFFPPSNPVELVDEQLIVAEPQGSAHFDGIRAVEEALPVLFGEGLDVVAWFSDLGIIPVDIAVTVQRPDQP